ncbi:helix-turn-helix domain-containing protein [Paraflavitalea sp. CAU 1676]|uniref:GlxA family transcriptional regulator n=1 Tax=Paraflavitalea sp. CAU 1676 TaxID=3032598 RepID=UPI0023DCA45A|nr:helix-turn-helix domain-containing protein [Paraflavitalea sp. CAU 1676]MDF2186800.1 helix-turn-helix domain-containing protein [Paraflavitalea sp. CAU 1676]
MKHISVLIPEGDISLTNVEGIHHIFAEVNKASQRAGKPPLFHFQLVGKHHSQFMKQNFFSIHPNYLITDDFRSDLVIIPALHGDIFKSVEINQGLVPWIVDQYTKGAEVMSLCTGAFLLGSTGLLRGRSCATHWIHVNEFREMYPDVTVVDDKIMTDEGGIYTSGAAYSYLNLILYYIEKHASRDIAILIAKIFALDMGRTSQSQFIIFQGYKQHSDESVLKAQEYIEQNYQQKISVDEIATHVSLGRRNFERRFKSATSNSVFEYLQRVKVEAAKKQLEHGRKTINEVMYDTGYTDIKAFRDVFRKVVGMSPGEYRLKYTREPAL